MVLVVLTTLNIHSQTGLWYRENFVPMTVDSGFPNDNSAQDYSALTVDNNGNVYSAFKFIAAGKMFVAKFDPNGNILWQDRLEDFEYTNVQGMEIINNGGTDYLYIAFDSQTLSPTMQSLGVICYDMSSGAIQWGYSYVVSGFSIDLNNFSVGSDGSLILTGDDRILFLDKDGDIVEQLGSGALPVKTDLSSTFGTSPDADIEGLFTNTETTMPFSAGSPLAGTPTPIDVYNAEKEWVFGTTYSGNDPVGGDQYSLDSNISFIPGDGFVGGSANTQRATILNNDGLYIHSTTTLNGYSHQAITKLNKNDKTTVEWSYVWIQSDNTGAIKVDEYGNVYVVSWDQIFFLNSSAIDILITKFDKDGNHLWSKVYGNGTNTGNEVIWRSNGVAIDTVNQKLILNTYTDSFDDGNPKAAILTIDYDGVLQNYNIVGVDGNQYTPISITTGTNGDVYGTALNSGNQGGVIFKVNTNTVFNDPAPVFTSTNTATTPDNIDNTTVVLDVEANDGDGGATDTSVTYSLSGDDEDDFTIDPATGEIKFAVAPDFGNPADANGDNVYEISVIADNGNAGNNTTEQVITITVTDSSTLSTEIIDGVAGKLNVLVSNSGKDLTIQLKDATEGEVVLYSLIGQQVYQGKHIFVNGSLTINNLNLKKNTIYLLNCKAAGANKTVKFMF